MGASESIGNLLKDAASLMKSDPKGAVAKLESAFAIATQGGDAHDIAEVSEELARGWARRKSAARSLYFAAKATKVAPERKAAWTTLAKTCELIATRTPDAHKHRAAVLYRSAAAAFKQAASFTKDPEDKRWLMELAGDAARQGKSLA